MAQILGNGADVETRAEERSTALMVAALHGHTQVIKTLLEKGAEVNATDRMGGTALMAAASAGHADVVKQLLAAGSDRWLRRWNGEMAATLASFRGHKDVLASLFDVESFSIELMHEKATKPGGKDAARLADAWYVQATWQGDREILERPLPSVRQALEAIPRQTMQHRRDSQCWCAFRMRRRQQRNMKWRFSTWSVRSLSARPWQNGIPRLRFVRKEIANLYGSLATGELLCKRPQRAIAAARTALDLDASPVWNKAVLAHGLLLAGQFDEAKNLYLEIRSVRLSNGRSLASLVPSYFGELRADRISHPDMGRIEKLLRTENGAGDVK